MPALVLSGDLLFLLAPLSHSPQASPGRPAEPTGLTEVHSVSAPRTARLACATAHCPNDSGEFFCFLEERLMETVCPHCNAMLRYPVVRHGPGRRGQGRGKEGVSPDPSHSRPPRPGCELLLGQPDPACRRPAAAILSADACVASLHTLSSGRDTARGVPHRTAAQNSIRRTNGVAAEKGQAAGRSARPAVVARRAGAHGRPNSWAADAVPATRASCVPSPSPPHPPPPIAPTCSQSLPRTPWISCQSRSFRSRLTL